MKKILIFLLAALFVVTSTVLVACNKNVTGIKIEGAPAEVEIDATIDYSKINIVATYENNTTKTLKLTDKGVEHNNIETNKTGNQVLTVTYKGQTAQTNINVIDREYAPEELLITGYSNALGYRSYLDAKGEQDNKETQFYNRDVNYKVGFDNGFHFVPYVNGVVTAHSRPVVVGNVQTTYKLYHKSGDSFVELAEADQATYLSKVEKNTYYFTEQANHETFKLEVTLSDVYAVNDDQMNKTVSCEFDVVEGYNVYDALGLSVLDTWDVKAWADIKNTQLAWDSKKLSEYDVNWVILHNDITVYPKDLPASYFWKTTDQAVVSGSKSYNDAFSLVPEDLRSYMPGSLKEVCRGEEWEEGGDSQQRALFVSDGTGVSGNYLTLTYAEYNPGEENDPSANKIAIVHDMNMNAQHQAVYPESHTSLIAFTNAKENDDDIHKPRTIENVYLNGHNPKSEGTTTPAGLMMMTSDMKGVKLINDIGNMWFCNATLDGLDVGELTIEKCKLYDSFSQMVFSWGAAKIDISDSEMKRAGGPILIIQTVAFGKGRPTEMTVTNSQLESWITGSEMWFTINMGGSATVIPQLIQLATAIDSVGGTSFHHIDDGKYMANLVAVVIPDPGDVMDNEQAIPGAITVGEYRYAMENSVFSTLVDMPNIATKAADNLNGAMTLVGAAGQDTTQIAQIKKGFEDLAGATKSLPIAPVYQSGNTYAYFDGSRPVSLNTLVTNVKTLCGYTQQVIDQMSANPMASMVVSQLQNNIIDKLKCISDLEVGDDATWAQSWTEDTLAFWVNPGGLVEKDEEEEISTNIKHFMIMLGEYKG